MYNTTTISRWLFLLGSVITPILIFALATGQRVGLAPLAFFTALMIPHLARSFSDGFGHTVGPGETSDKDYPTYDWNFMENITWRCINCENEIYWQDGDSQLTCHYCDTVYDLSPEDIPQPLRAKCWECGNVSDNVSGSRAENLSFDCPNCAFVWKSDPY